MASVDSRQRHRDVGDHLGRVRLGRRKEPPARRCHGAPGATIIPVQPLPAGAGLACGRFRASLEKRGETIGGNDLWIAAHAAAASLVLVTNNERAFKRIKTVKVENWVG